MSPPETSKDEIYDLDAKENEENVKLRDTTAKQRFVSSWSSSSVASGAQEQENRELREKISKLHSIVVKFNIGDGEDQPNFLITSQFEVLKAQIQRIAIAFYYGDYSGSRQCQQSRHIAAKVL